MDGPKIIAARHYKVDSDVQTLVSDCKRISEFLEGLSKEDKQRTLFIEGDKKIVDHYLKYISHGQPPKEIENDPFFIAIQIAKRENWRIIPLDKSKVGDMAFELTTGSNDALTRRYIDKNLRQRYWAHYLRREKPQSGDLIVMHPNQIEGFLEESGMDPNDVVRISQLTSDFSPRLDPEEIKELMARRKQTREQRSRQKT